MGHDTQNVRSTTGDQSPGGSRILKTDTAAKLLGAREVVSKVDVHKFADFVRLLKEERRASPKQGDELTVPSYDARNNALLMPRSFYDEQNLIGIMLLKLADDLNAKVTLYETSKYSIKEPVKEVRDFWIGACIGADDNINIHIKKRTCMIETGRAASMAIRVRGEFRNNDKLTIAALRKNHAFFANDPQVDPRTKQFKEIPILDEYLTRYLENASEEADVRRVICSMLEKTRLLNFSDQLRRLLLKANIVEYADLCDPHRKKPHGEEQVSRKKVLKKEKGKLPEKPSQSPLFSREEMEIISSYIDPVWQALVNVTHDYFGQVEIFGYMRIRLMLQKVFSLRWAILNSFANESTNRLRELKKNPLVENASRLTKKKVSEAELLLLSKRRLDHPDIFIRELSRILEPLRSVQRSDPGVVVLPEKVKQDLDSLEEKLSEVRIQHMLARNALAPEPEGVSIRNTYKLLEEDEHDEKKKVIEQYSMVTAPFNIILQDMNGKANKFLFPSESFVRLLELIKNYPTLSLISPESLELIRVGKQKTFGPNTPIAKFFKFLLTEEHVDSIKGSLLSPKRDGVMVIKIMDPVRGEESPQKDL